MISRKLTRPTPAEITLIHVIGDNVSTHQGKRVQAWLAAHPRFQMRVTPVACCARPIDGMFG